MPDYRIIFARSARKELEELPAQQVERIFRKIRGLAGEPRPSGCRKLTGGQNLWRIRVGEYRVIYFIYDAENLVDITAIRHRSEAYR